MRRFRPDEQQTVGVVQAVVNAERLNAVDGRSRSMRRNAGAPRMQMMVSPGEEPAPFVDPDLKAGLPCVGDEIRVAVAIEVRDDEPDDRIGCVQLLPLARRGKPDGELARAAGDLDAIVNTIAIEIRFERIRLRDIRDDQGGETTERSQHEPAQRDQWHLEDASIVQGSSHFDRATIMQNPD